MNALRFGKTDIRLGDAAIILATSQEEWATYIACSIEDWCMGGFYYRAANMVMRIMKDGYPSLWEKDYISTEKDFHDILVRPHPRVPAGWVYLERTL
jgi:hypothetical protein